MTQSLLNEAEEKIAKVAHVLICCSNRSGDLANEIDGESIAGNQERALTKGIDFLREVNSTLCILYDYLEGLESTIRHHHREAAAQKAA